MKKDARAGYAYGLSAYLIWGVLPLYFVLLGPIDSFELVAWRILLTVVFCAVLLTLTRQWGEVAAVMRDRRTLALLAVAGLLVGANWQIFVIAAATGHVLDASLGYFINPVVVVLLAVLLLGERLSAMQWVAVATTVVAFAVISVGYGIFPWVALTLAGTFGLYGLLKNRLGGTVGALTGQFVETAALAPVGVVMMLVVAATSGLTAPGAPAGLLTALAFIGPVTAVPLMLFAAAAGRLPFAVLGFLQYIAPTMMFFSGWLLLGEEVPPARWAGFGMVWISLVLLSVDSIRRLRRR